MPKQEFSGRQCPTSVTVAATQMACGPDVDANIERAEGLVRRAASEGANIILLQEMFYTRFFAFMDWKDDYFHLAAPADGHPIVKHMATLARELDVVLPVNVFERANNAYYNTIVVVDADGRDLGAYRKSHMPLGPPGCFEKYYTCPGDTGFRVWNTRFGNIGVGICWDQWFPESARIMALMGADVLFFPTGIGSDAHDHWQRTIQGHAAANMTPVVVSNRIGTESGELGTSSFWGQSFITGARGEIVAEADDSTEIAITARFDVEDIRAQRAGWGLFRDRRPDLYGPLLSLDGMSGSTSFDPSPRKVSLS